MGGREPGLRRDEFSFPRLENEALALRPWSDADQDELVEACNDPLLRDQLGVPAPYTKADARDYIALCANGWASGEQFIFAATRRATQRIVGSIRVAPSPGGATAGYWTAPWARGRGVATDALRLVTDWALAHGLTPIRLYISPSNIASQRVATKAGYQRAADDAILDPEGVPGDFVFVKP